MVTPSAPRLKHVLCTRPNNTQRMARMAYWEWGDPLNSKAVVCVHGLSRQGRDFDTLAQALAPYYRVICPDVLGRGQSDWLFDCSGYEVSAYALDMLGLLAQCKAQEVHWIGTSMGGLIGLVLSSFQHNTIAPMTSMTRLVLNDVGPVIEWAAIERIQKYLGQALSWATIEHGAQALKAISQGFGSHTNEQWLALSRPMFKRQADAWVLHYDPRIAEPFKRLTPQTCQAHEAVLWKLYDAISCPTLLLRGADSDLLSSHTAQAMRTRGPHAQWHEFCNVGHAPMLNNPAQIKVVKDFLLAV
jgi:pimeloyl-ACP methyl ester carboxylesterase